MDRDLRELTWERSKGYCEHCGKPLDPEGWHWSHRKGKAQGGIYHIQNGLATTPHCHLVKITNHPKIAMQNGWMVSRQDNPADIPVNLYGSILVYLTEDGGYRDPRGGLIRL